MSTNNEPLVSVVIPVYNRSKLINRTLTSVLNQTYQNIEVIVVDDFSDDSKELQAELSKFDTLLNINYIRHEQNKHGGASRNTGIKSAKGEYIALLDSDDEWLPSKLSKTINVLVNSDVDFVYSKIKTEGRRQSVFPKRGLSVGERLSDYLLVNGGTIQTSSIVINSNVAKNNLFDETLVRFQDYDFVVSLEQSKSTSCFVDDVLVVMYDDDQEGRISNSYDVAPAVKWINKVSHKISKLAYSNFYMNRIVRYHKMRGNTKEALAVIINSNLTGKVDFKVRLKWFIICILPKTVLIFLSTVMDRVKRIF